MTMTSLASARTTLRSWADEQIGEVAFFLQPQQKFNNLSLNAHVEGGGGLIKHDEFGFQHHRPGDGHALSLPAGKFVGVAVPGRRDQGLLLIERLQPHRRFPAHPAAADEWSDLRNDLRHRHAR